MASTFQPTKPVTVAQFKLKSVTLSYDNNSVYVTYQALDANGVAVGEPGAAQLTDVASLALLGSNASTLLAGLGSALGVAGTVRANAVP